VASGYSTTLISTTTLSGASTTISSIPTTYSTLLLVMYNVANTSAGTHSMTINGVTSGYSGTVTNTAWSTSCLLSTLTNGKQGLAIRVDNAKATTGNKYISGVGSAAPFAGILPLSAAITSITFTSSNTYSTGTVELIGM
jgi:hypothetical protein